MKWDSTYSDGGNNLWKRAWWVMGKNSYLLKDRAAYIMTLRGRKGYFICTYTENGWTAHYGPMGNLEAAKTAFQLVTSEERV